MSELATCGMCGAPWAQMCQEKDKRIAELKADRKAHAENEMRLMDENAKLKAKAERLEQENERLRRAADVVVKTYDYVTGWTTEMDNAVCDLIRILESSDE